MYETGIICLLIIIIIMLFIVLLYCLFMYNNYQNDRNDIEDTRDQVRKVAIAILANEGIPVNEVSISETKPKRSTFRLFGN